MVWKPHQITQLGYVCRRLEDAVQYFCDQQGAGPFYTMDVPPDAANYLYRGQRVAGLTKNRVAFGYRGPIQFEIIESDNPVFDHLRGEKDMVFHHVMQMTADFEAEKERYISRGFATMGVGEMPGVLIHYIDTLEAVGHYTELFNYDIAIEETGGAMFKLFEIMFEKAKSWDGSRPLRPLDELA